MNGPIVPCYKGVPDVSPAPSQVQPSPRFGGHAGERREPEARVVHAGAARLGEVREVATDGLRSPSGGPARWVRGTRWPDQTGRGSGRGHMAPLASGPHGGPHPARNPSG